MLLGLVALAVAAALGRALSPAAPPAIAARGVSATAGIETPAYPYESTTRVGPWGFVTRHAGDYVAWRFFERNVAFSATMNGPTGTAGRFAEPATWATNATGIGFRVDSVPMAGAIAQWNAGEAGAGGAGHVAYVERVNPDGSVMVSEFDWSAPNRYSQRDGVRPPRYIHIQDR